MSRKSILERLNAVIKPYCAPRSSFLRWLSALTVGTFFLTYLSPSISRTLHSKLHPLRIQVPEDIEIKSVAQFDKLVRRGKVLYEDTNSELFSHDGFQFEFRITPVFKQKPVLGSKAPGRSKAGGPFVDPDPEEIIIDLGHSHRLMVNKFCVYRPMLVVPTKEFALQTDDLNLSDMEAAWTVLKAFTTPSVVIYNCGVRAGSSQGHKHLQMFPLPTHELWPAKAVSFDHIEAKAESVPFRHFVLRLSKSTNSVELHRAYSRLLKESREALAESDSDSQDYNVVFTKEWIAVIPRRTAGPGGPFGANAAGMLGMVTVPDQNERDWWAKLGYTEYLVQLGVPFTD